MANGLAADHRWLGEAAGVVERWLVPLFAVATCFLWLLARPRGERRWSEVTVAALGSAALAMLANQALAHIWERPRPYASHLDAVVFVARSHDPSFPSDHAAAAFAIAVAVLLFFRRLGAVFVLAATLIAAGRVVAGVHYPLDVVVGALVGIASAMAVTKLARRWVDRAALLLGRLTDPLVAPAWRIVAGRRNRS